MERRQGRSRRETTPLWWLLALILLAVVILLGHSVWVVWGKNRASQAVRREAEDQLATVVARHEKLELKVKKMETLRGQEEEVRKNFPVARAGEQVVIILDETSTTTNQTAKPDKKWWQKIWKSL